MAGSGGDGGGGGWRREPGRPVTVLAHRGGAGPWPENSLDAFAGALAAGADGVELDVRRTADGVLVVHHDPEVAGVGPIARARAEDLPARVPTLARALAACTGARVDVEIKNLPTEPDFDPGERVAAEVAALLGGGGGPGARPAGVIVSSFWPGSLAAVRAAAGPAPGPAPEPAGPAPEPAGPAPGPGRVPAAPALGLLVHPALDAGEALDTAVDLGCAALHPHHSAVTPALVRRCHERGLAVATWTVNTPAELAAVVAAGVDVVITDRVGETMAGLRRG